MRLSRTALLLALLAFGAFFWWRSPPQCVRRLDGGGDSGGFGIDDRTRRLYYATGWPRGSAVHAVDLADGRIATREFPGQMILGVLPDSTEDFARVGLEAIGASPPEGRFTMMLVDGADASIKIQTSAKELSPETLSLYATSFSTTSLLPENSVFNRTPDGTPTGYWAQIAPPSEPPGIIVRLILKNDRIGAPKNFETRSRPAAFVITSSSTIVAAYEIDDGSTVLEEIEPLSGKRRPFAKVAGGARSMALAGDGLVVLREAPGGSRLSFVSLARRAELMDLAWSKAGSRILGVDPLRRKLYFHMTVARPGGGDDQSAWAVSMDQDSLRSAAKFFSAMHEWPELRWKLIGHSVEILIAAFVLAATVYFYGTMREI